MRSSNTPWVDGYVTINAAEPIAVLGGLVVEIAEVDVAVVVALHHHDAHTGHHRRRRVRTVRGCGNQADVALRLAT